VGSALLVTLATILQILLQPVQHLVKRDTFALLARHQQQLLFVHADPTAPLTLALLECALQVRGVPRLEQLLLSLVFYV